MLETLLIAVVAFPLAYLSSKQVAGTLGTLFGKAAENVIVTPEHFMLVAIVGGVLPEVEDLCDDPALGLTAVFSINRQAMDFAQSRYASRENYTYTLNSILRLLRAAETK